MTPIKGIGINIDKYCGFSTDLEQCSVSYQLNTTFKEFLQ